MRKTFRIVSFLLVVCLISGMFAGCDNLGFNRPAYVKGSTECVASGVMAENDTFILEWDNDSKCVISKNKKTGSTWSTTPYDLYLEGEMSALISSPIEINVINTTTKVIDFDRAYSACYLTGNMSAEKIDNGIKVTYYFDTYKVSVPICYIIRDDSIAITFDTTKVTEGNEYKLLSVSIAPFLCSSANEVEGNYLFVPSGTGALMSTTTFNGENETFTSEVYGIDGSRLYEERPIENETVKMPVFGAKDGDKAIMGIIEQGAEMAEIRATAGNKRTDYSGAYTTVYTRGYDIYADTSGWASDNSISKRNSEAMTDQTVVVGYYFLEGDKANYVGMAERYRQYLIEKKGLKKSDEKQSAYALSILGNLATKNLAFGFPYTAVESLTTFNEASTMITELSGSTGNYPTVQLKGFGTTGINVGEIAGGYKFASASGSLADYKKIEELAKDGNFLLSVDFDLVNFNKAGSGVSKVLSTAKSPSKFKVKQKHNDLALRWFTDFYDGHYLVNRGEVSRLVDKLIKKASKLGITGISTASLGQITYSDYSELKYATKGETENEVCDYLTRIKNAGYKVVTENSNAYAATVSDAILNLQIDSYNMNGLDQTVPFYQIVYKGYIPLYSEALNLSSNSKQSVLNALATGTGLGYTLIGNYEIDYVANSSKELYNSLYRDIKDDITSAVNSYKSYYEAIDGAKIVDYKILGTGVTETIFDNGVKAYTNPNQTAQNSPIGELSAYEFKFVK